MFDEDQHGFNFFWGQTVADALDNVDDVIELHLGDKDIGNQHHHGMDGKMHVVPCVEIGDTVIQIVDEGAVCFRKLPPRRGGEEQGEYLVRRGGLQHPFEYLSRDGAAGRKKLGTDQEKTGKYTGAGCFTIVAEADGVGASMRGLLKAYEKERNEWSSLDFVTRI